MTMGRQPAIGIDLLAAVEIHDLLLLLHLVVFVAFAQRFHLRLQLLHLAHRLVGAVGEREEGELDEHRDDEDGDAEIADLARDEVDAFEDRLRQEPEIAPVDQQVEAVDAGVAIGVDDLGDLRSGEETVRRPSPIAPGATVSAS